MTAGLTKGQRSPIGPLGKLSQGPQANGDLSKRGVGLGRGPNQMAKTPNAAWTQAWPAPGSTLDLDFANNRGWVRGVGQGGVMDAITFTRASNGTYVGPDGLLAGAGSDAGALGKNLLTFPQNFENAAWAKTGSTITSNASSAPNATNTASMLTETTSTSSHQTSYTYTGFVAGSAYTFSIYAKAATNSFVQLVPPTLIVTSGFANFDLANGTVGTSGGTGLTAAIQSVGSGWYRCSITVASSAGSGSGSPTILLVRSSSAARLSNYTGDGTSGIFIWGAQLETGSSATTYFPTNINTPRFDWASTTALVQNLLTYTEDFSNAIWVKSTVTVTSGQTAPDGTTTAWSAAPSSGTTFSFYEVYNFTGIYTASVYVKDNGRGFCGIACGRNTSGYLINIDLTTGAVVSERSYGGGVLVGYSISNVGSGWWRVSISATSTNSGLYISGGDSVSSAAGILIWHPQLEAGSTATTYLAVGAIPVANTPLAATSTSNGLLIEESRANALLWCRDATNAAWVKTTMTAALNQTGIDGVANAASSLTATNANATCIQTITAASASKTGSVYLKRITGTGTVQVSLDGTTYSTVDLSNGLWNRVVLSGTVTNPVVGIKIVTSGDAVAMDYGQVEPGAFATSPIYTTTASATRSADNATMLGQSFVGWYNIGVGTFVAQADTGAPAANNPFVFSASMNDGTNNSRVSVFAETTNWRFFVNNLNVSQAAINVAGFTVRSNAKLAATYSSGTFNLAVNGTAGTQSNGGTVPNVEALFIGRATTNTLYLNGRIKRITYVQKRLPDDALKALTS